MAKLESVEKLDRFTVAAAGNMEVKLIEFKHLSSAFICIYYVSLKGPGESFALTAAETARRLAQCKYLSLKAVHK